MGCDSCGRRPDLEVRNHDARIVLCRRCYNALEPFRGARVTPFSVKEGVRMRQVKVHRWTFSAHWLVCGQPAVHFCTIIESSAARARLLAREEFSRIRGWSGRIPDDWVSLVKREELAARPVVAESGSSSESYLMPKV